MDVQRAWSRLLSVHELAFEARSRAATYTGWNGSGRGAVQIEAVESGVILFHERGAWSPDGGRQSAFSNVFRWTADSDGRFIRLEHLRFGPEHPVYLFDLVSVDNGILESSEPHVCREDLYAARMECDEQAVRLTWTINGPKKAENISYIYR
jgi:Family of unknown function (DUF6314)